MLLFKNNRFHISSIVIGVVLMSGFFTYVYADETGEIHSDSPIMKTQEGGAKEMKMGEQEHQTAVEQARKKYLERMKKIQGKYTADLAIAKKEKSKKKELVAKKVFAKAKADAQKIYQKERNIAMKQAMKKKK